MPRDIQEGLCQTLLRQWGAGGTLSFLDWLAGTEGRGARGTGYDIRFVVRRWDEPRSEEDLAIRIESSRATAT